MKRLDLNPTQAQLVGRLCKDRAEALDPRDPCEASMREALEEVCMQLRVAVTEAPPPLSERLDIIDVIFTVLDHVSRS